MKQFKNVEIILEESQAVLANSLYIIPLGNGKAKAIVTDANANKVTITSDTTSFQSIKSYNSNEEALSDGLSAGDIYYTEEGTLKIVI